MLVSELELAIDVGGHLEAVGVAWCIGGSVASSLLGIPRTTLDVDLVADLRLAHVRPLCERLITAYYVDEDTCRWAVQERRSFNAIHLATMVKVDIFCAGSDPLSRDELDRRIMLELGDSRVPVCSAEDIILQKLLWYVQAGGSERQWGDASGVVQVRGGSLDRGYLERHAAAAGLSDLLCRLLEPK